MNKLKHIFVIFLTAALFACGGPKEPEGAGKYGMMDNSTPEGAALLFFGSIYKEKTYQNTLQYASPRMTRLLKSYHTPRAGQRHVLNLQYDQVPEMQLDSGDGVGRTEFAKEAEVSVFFSGTYNGDKIDELRTVKLIRTDKKWLVDSIKADKYL